jgi:signal transduction histidine kinase
MTSDVTPVALAQTSRALWPLLPGGALLLAAAYGVGAQASTPLCTAAAVSGLALCAWGARAISIRLRAAALLPMEVPRTLWETGDLSTRLLALEAQLEFAPVALFRFIDGALAASFDPVNAYARRLLAPGRAADADALRATLHALPTGQRTMIGFATERGDERALAIVNALTVEGQPQRLVAVFPVESELEAEAMQAWQKLVHVMTHEIMNSLTPVASLSHTSRELLADARSALPDEIAGDLDIALDAIGRRAESLQHFVSGYRALASAPPAQPQPVAIRAMFDRLEALTAPGWLAIGGSVLFEVEPASLELMADPGQLEQALVNLLQNAAEACVATKGSDVAAAPQVRVSARLSRGGRLRIEVSDNGPGVPDHLLADIFTPFFTTKSRGSGIGLALVRQLVHRNGGTVRYAKSVGGGACFVLAF